MCLNIRLVKYIWFIHVARGVKKWDRYAYIGMKKVPRSMKKQNDKYSVSHKAFCVIKKAIYALKFVLEIYQETFGMIKDFIFVQFKFSNHLYILFLSF